MVRFSGRMAIVSLLSMCVISFSTLCATPVVDFFCPPTGDVPPIKGTLTGVTDPSKYKVIIVVTWDFKIWHDKTHICPSGRFNQGGEGIPIATDGSFTVTGWGSVPLNTYELTTPYIGLWVVPTTFDASWANFQIEDAPMIPQRLTDATVCMTIKNRDNGVEKRWPEVTAVRQIQPASKNTTVNLNNAQNQSPTNLYTVTGKKVFNANQNRSAAGRGIYVAPGQKNSIRPTQRVNTVNGNN
jgi:hypothetical protein